MYDVLRSAKMMGKHKQVPSVFVDFAKAAPEEETQNNIIYDDASL